MRKHYLAVAVLIGVCSANRAIATTVIVAVTPNGIVIGADGKTTSDKTAPTTAVKVFLLKKHLVVADIYSESAKSDDGQTSLYDFPFWIKKIDQRTDPKVSVDRLTEIIKKQMIPTFTFAIKAIADGNLTKEQAAAAGVDAYLVQYIVSGYERGIPTVYSLILMPDWDTKTVNGPFQVPLKEESGKRADSHILWRGRGVGLERAMVPDSKEQKELSAKIPVEFSALREGKSLTLKQASNVVRAFLGIEARAEPDYVGFPITVVTIPKGGDGWVRTYKGDAPVFSGPAEKTLGEKDHAIQLAPQN